MGNSLSVWGEVAKVALAVAIPLGSGIAIGKWCQPEFDGPWFKAIKKPTWNPPGWLFGPVWFILHTSQGIASYLVYRQGGFEKNALPLGLYIAQVLVNIAWTPVFCKAKNIGLALLTNITLDALVYATIFQFAPVIGVPATAGLLGPYAGWISFATVLTAWMYVNNRGRNTAEAKPLLDGAASSDATPAGRQGS